MGIINITLDPSLSTAGSEDGECDGGVEQIGRNFGVSTNSLRAET